MSMGVIVVVVIVIAMLVVMMIVTTVVIVIIVVMVTMIVPGVIMSMRGVGRMRMARRIGAAFGIERRLDLDDPRAEPLHHRFDDMIAPNAQALGHDLGRQMAVAEMPGDPDQIMRIRPSDFDQQLRRRHHLDQATILEHQGVAAAQRDRVFEIKQKRKSARTGHRHPPPVPVVEIKHDGIDWGFRPAMLGLNSRCTDHAEP